MLVEQDIVARRAHPERRTAYPGGRRAMDLRRTRSRLAAILAFAALPLCLTPSADASHIATDGVLEMPGHQAETTAVVIPPNRNASCPKGRILISSIGQSLTPNEVSPGHYFYTSLDGRGPVVDLKSKFDPSLNHRPQYDSLLPGFDNQITRFPNGDILAARNTYINTPPEWPATQTVPSGFNWWNGSSGGRVGLVLSQSTNCGEAWQRVGVLDSASVLVGGIDQVTQKPFPPTRSLCAHPQMHNDKDGRQILIQGGWDRPDIYVDPWSPRTVYAAVRCDANVVRATPTKASPSDRPVGGKVNDALPAYQRALVFVSRDGGRNWANGYRPIFAGSGIPVAMSAPREGRVFMFQCNGTVPELALYDDRARRLAASSQPVYYVDPTTKSKSKCEGANPKQVSRGRPGLPAELRNAGTWSLAAVRNETRDAVLVVYPAVVGGNTQVARVVHADFRRNAFELDSPGGIRRRPVTTLKAKDPGESVLYATFIEPNGVEFRHLDKSDRAMLYWIETLNNGEIIARYMMFRAGKSVSKARDLAHPIATPGGAKLRPSWLPLGDFDIGDYIKGAFFSPQGERMGYFAQWPQRKDISSDTDVNYRIVYFQSR